MLPVRPLTPPDYTAPASRPADKVCHTATQRCCLSSLMYICLHNKNKSLLCCSLYAIYNHCQRDAVQGWLDCRFWLWLSPFLAHELLPSEDMLPHPRYADADLTSLTVGLFVLCYVSSCQFLNISGQVDFCHCQYLWQQWMINCLQDKCFLYCCAPHNLGCRCCER